MECLPTKKLPIGEQWMYEIKLASSMTLAFLSGMIGKIGTRNFPTRYIE